MVSRTIFVGVLSLLFLGFGPAEVDVGQPARLDFEVVSIAPSVARQADTVSPAKSGFVTLSGRPSPNHRSGT